MRYRLMFVVSIEYTEEYEKMAAGLGKSFFDYFLENSFGVFDYFESSVDVIGRKIALYNANEIKWYDFGEELLKISSAYTGCLFHCYVNGEDDDDFQEHYYKDGLHAASTGKIVYWTDKEKAKDKTVVLASNKKANIAMFYVGVNDATKA